MKTITSLLLIAIAAGTAACTVSPLEGHDGGAGVGSVAIEALHAGIQCGNNETGASARWIEDATQLESLYQPLNLAPAEIDFAQSVVVLVEMGERPTLGYRLGVAEAEAQMVEGHLEVVLEWREPPSDMMVGQMVTSPCLLLKLERGQYREVWFKDAQGLRRAVATPP